MTVQVRIGHIDLPALAKGADARLDEYRARRSWQIRDLAGNPVWAGLFVSPDLAARHCREEGWQPDGLPSEGGADQGRGDRPASEYAAQPQRNTRIRQGGARDDGGGDKSGSARRPCLPGLEG